MDVTSALQMCIYIPLHMRGQWECTTQLRMYFSLVSDNDSTMTSGILKINACLTFVLHSWRKTLLLRMTTRMKKFFLCWAMKHKHIATIIDTNCMSSYAGMQWTKSLKDICEIIKTRICYQKYWRASCGLKENHDRPYGSLVRLISPKLSDLKHRCPECPRLCL